MKTKSVLNNSGIYKITNKINNKFYIGSAINIRKRWKEHRNTLKKENHKNQHLQRAYIKYGFENFVYEVVEFIDLKCLKHEESKNKILSIEQKYLDKLKPWDRNVGYNLSKFACSPIGTRHTDLSRKRMSESHIGNKHTEESKKKISESQYKPVHQINVDGQIINTFSSCIEASNKTGVSRQNISMACRKITNYVGGFQWCYVELYDKFVSRLPKGCKPVKRIVDGNEISKWNSICEAAISIGVSYSTMQRKLKQNVEYKYV